MNAAEPSRAEWRGRVLLVDDEPWMLKVMEAVLSSDLDVVVCTSGAQALKHLGAQPFDVVCSDYRMPGMDGVALLKAAAQVQEDVSRLLVTAAADFVPGDERREHYVLIKPFDPERLLRLVTQLARVSHAKRTVKVGASRLSAPPEPLPPSSRRGEAADRRRTDPPAPMTPRPGGKIR